MFLVLGTFLLLLFLIALLFLHTFGYLRLTSSTLFSETLSSTPRDKLVNKNHPTPTSLRNLGPILAVNPDRHFSYVSIGNLTLPHTQSVTAAAIVGSGETYFAFWRPTSARAVLLERVSVFLRKDSQNHTSATSTESSITVKALHIYECTDVTYVSAQPLLTFTATDATLAISMGNLGTQSTNKVAEFVLGTTVTRQLMAPRPIRWQMVLEHSEIPFVTTGLYFEMIVELVERYQDLPAEQFMERYPLLTPSGTTQLVSTTTSASTTSGATT